MTERNIEEVHKVNTDPLGTDTPYYRQFRKTSDGDVVSGHGVTEEQAVIDAQAKLDEREAYLAKTDVDKLLTIIEQKDILHREIVEAIKILGRLALNEASK